jgi:hypothetical protein
MQQKKNGASTVRAAAKLKNDASISCVVINKYITKAVTKYLVH